MCGKDRNFIKDYQKGFRVCFNSNQMGHVKVDFPLVASRSVQTLDPATLRITDGYQGKGEASKFRGEISS